ncbi:MAG: DUF2933 domain-containing protein [Bdellovibrionales bacterium]|nr:DUF2933 domain-containing protein [Bdellovibrionales bacterium]
MNDITSCDHDSAQVRKKFDLYQIGKWGAIAIITYYLLTEHRAHMIAYFPYLFLLACPLMHFFMHGSHGNHQHHQDEKEQS